MNSRYAAVFGIENLVLNKHYCIESNTDQQQCTVTAITINAKLLDDITLAIKPLEVNSLVHGEDISFNNNQLVLPADTLSSDEKRTLWATMSKHLDKL
jgi:hypothetical protein